MYRENASGGISQNSGFLLVSNAIDAAFVRSEMLTVKFVYIHVCKVASQSGLRYGLQGMRQSIVRASLICWLGQTLGKAEGRQGEVISSQGTTQEPQSDE